MWRAIRVKWNTSSLSVNIFSSGTVSESGAKLPSIPVLTSMPSFRYDRLCFRCSADSVTPEPVIEWTPLLKTRVQSIFSVEEKSDWLQPLPQRRGPYDERLQFPCYDSLPLRLGSCSPHSGTRKRLCVAFFEEKNQKVRMIGM